MRSVLVNLHHCVAPFLSRAATACTGTLLQPLIYEIFCLKVPRFSIKTSVWKVDSILFIHICLSNDLVDHDGTHYLLLLMILLWLELGPLLLMPFFIYFHHYYCCSTSLLLLQYIIITVAVHHYYCCSTSLLLLQYIKLAPMKCFAKTINYVKMIGGFMKHTHNL